MKKISIVIVFCLSLSGCFNYKEIRDSAVVTAISIDVSDTAKYKIGAEVIKAGDMGDSLENQVIIVDSNSLSEGLSDIVKVVNKNVYLGYCELVILGEKFAEKGISEVLDYFIRNTEYRNDMLIFISKNCDAKDILNIKNVEEKIIGHGLSDSLKADEDYQSTSVYSKLYRILNEIETKNCSAQVSVLKKESNNDEEIIKISGSSFFYKDKLLGYLDENDTFLLNLLNNNVKFGNFTAKHDEKIIGIRLLNSKCKIKIKNNSINIDLYVSASITEDSDRTFNEDIYNKIVAENLKENIDEVLSDLFKDKKSDLIGLYSKINLSEDVFADYLYYTKPDVKVNVKIKGSGINEYYS